jgi:uncharacterized protein YdaU (DUF1376 family)
MKVRYLEHHPDEWLVGVAGLTPEQNGIYRTVCDLIASTGGPIPVDDERLFGIVKAKRNRIKRVISELLAGHKLTLSGSQLSNNRVISELERANNRARIGSDLAAKRWNLNHLGDADRNARARNKLNQEPRTINHKPKETRASRASSNDAFDRWYEGYPRKDAKGAARKAFEEAMKKTSLEELIAGVNRYIANKPPTQAYCHPATWLNQERWTDVPAAQSNGHDSGFNRGPTEPAPTLEGFEFPVDRPH